ncbi:AgmX/PglI C-terminal domain-containing protein [Archangium violaceum]|uniref:AgmX/PglI C-terminal domain-containing protein n=1 Tax=Archangium violaceum TaxID=83451 RepID=UPI0036DBDD64
MANPCSRIRGVAAGAVLLGVTSVAQPPPSKPAPQQSTVSAGSADNELDALFRVLLTPGGIWSETPMDGGMASPAPRPGTGALESFPCEEELLAVVLNHKQAILQCVNEQKKRQPGLSGKLVMRWSLQTNGKTKDVSCRTPELCSTYLAGCLSGLIQGWSFPKPRAQRGPIDFPFTF